MADVARHRYSQSIGTLGSAAALAATSSGFEMVPNPDFAFPRIPPPAIPSDTSSGPLHTSARPVSMYTSAPPPRAIGSGHSHRRTASTLPTFNFNAADTSGFTADDTRPITPKKEAMPGEPITSTPSRHVRKISEFVGGDSRLGMANAVRTSPDDSTKQLPPRRNAHRRGQSIALSHHDLNSIMAAPDTPRLSSSLPSTPIEQPFSYSHPVHDTESSEPRDGVSSLSRLPTNDRPTSSRREVAFSPNVEIIPRPLSTISSETESSISTIRGHSVNNSISSMLSLGMPTPVSARIRSPSLEVMPEDVPQPSLRPASEVFDRRLSQEKEGEWLKNGRSAGKTQRPVSQSAPASNKLVFTGANEPTAKSRPTQTRRQSSGNLFGIDRRKSEPLIGIHASEHSRFSAISLQDSTLPTHTGTGRKSLGQIENRSSTRKIKDWAFSKFSRKPKDPDRSQPDVLAVQAHQPGFPDQVEDVDSESAGPQSVAETDLDAVFSRDETRPGITQGPTMFEMPTPTPSHHSSFTSRDSDEYGSMVDLDAAMGPVNTPGNQKPRRELHSNRLKSDFSGPGGHYLPTPSHRRAESAPMLMAFDMSRMPTPPQSGMADVFEEDEEEDTQPKTTRSPSIQSFVGEESGIGIQVVDADSSTSDSFTGMSLDAETRTRPGDWEMERPARVYGYGGSRLSMPVLERRTSSVLDQPIQEEPSNTDSLDIVQSYEDPRGEPRAPSFTKSSDSSDTPTLLAPPQDLLYVSDGQRLVMTPDTLLSSAFSSPDFGPRPGSFDTSRLGTSASSVTDNRTMSSYGGEQLHDVRRSVDDVPSLTSSRSTMLSAHANPSSRDMSGVQTSVAIPCIPRPMTALEQGRKRGSMHSLSHFLPNSFSTKTQQSPTRPSTAADDLSSMTPRKKEHRLKKLMFWKSRHASTPN